MEKSESVRVDQREPTRPCNLEIRYILDIQSLFDDGDYDDHFRRRRRPRQHNRRRHLRLPHNALH